MSPVAPDTPGKVATSSISPSENGNTVHESHQGASTDGNSWPVDHGWLPWLQVIGGWILAVNGWGLTNTYGHFQTYYVHHLLPSYSASSISWIGSLQLFLTMAFCLPVGILYDHGHLYSLVIAGTLLEVLGLVGTSFSTNYWQVLVFQGIMCGSGCGIVAILTSASVARWFEKRRLWAAGIVISGTSFAGMVYPLMLKSLFPKIGFAWGTRTLALIILCSNAISLTMLRKRPGNALGKNMLEHLKDLPYVFMILSWLLTMMAAYVPFFYIQDYALNIGIDQNMAYTTLVVMNAANFVGRFALGKLADRYGGVNTLVPLNISLIAILLAFRAVSGLAGMLTVTILFGFASGAIISFQAFAMLGVSKDPKSQVGAKMGIGYVCAAFGGLLGNPLSGALEKVGQVNAQQRFQGVWFCSAGFMLASTIVLMAVRKMKLGTPWKKGKV
ncbi:major facilitator superfamily domain-containing protein [Lophiotrema nucula]|uniref:Major facilitator superfamily domain-containing protein n=1 Tax=Lophiotrema nucula TaxID=690887 RepID=A0A6A5YYS0_9PLEO|nr:major facilitator superfamily domain-containing protein [Lophiotrema nucula]